MNNTFKLVKPPHAWLKAALGLALAVMAGAASADAVNAGSISIERGAQKVLREASPVTRVAIGDPDIADVSVVNKKELLITGKKAGRSSLTIWSESAPTAPRQFSLTIGPAPISIAGDAELAKAKIATGSNLQGVLPNLAAHRRAELATINNGKDPVSDLSSVDLPTQVMTEVKIAEVSRSTLQQFGVNLLKNSLNTTIGVQAPGTLGSIDGSNGFFDVKSSAPLQSAFNIVAGNYNKSMLGVLSVMEGKGLARVLAEPSLLATSGQTATYLAGGEFPVPVPQGGAGQGSITVSYKEFGVRLSLSPTVLSRDRISLKVAPEVSDLDFNAAIQAGGVSVPALTVRRTDTTIELGDGESFVISGLVSNNLKDNVNKVPWLGSLPVLGAFFRSTTLRKEEKELIMIVTPHLVRPLARNAPRPQLPGSQYDNFDPSAAQTFLMESGKFDTGFSH